MIVASHGIMSVLRYAKNNSVRPRNTRNENAYAARLAVTRWPMTTGPDTTKLMSRHPPVGIRPSTFPQFSNGGATGSKGGGERRRWGSPGYQQTSPRADGKGARGQAR